jgi:GTPase SAR1 family protein
MLVIFWILRKVWNDLYYRSMSGKDETRVKLLIIGESYVGKSSLLIQYVDE